ncbi:chromate transporter [Acidisoma cellulosilytica]|uniref:Chromate transporter n=1 Tax=Acidisoma cellulosilyticum TaxID=2802395 RepID=A0A963Z2Q2_9PROT|nr:chromate transporter [Acidisoma cellulosilyticum]MCB8881644.1 chromate transporter [Acidisoma cellulosilyticum]
MSHLLALALIFAELSFLAIGGASTTLPAMEHAVVHQQHWMSATEFVRLYALAQAAPGPNMLAVTLFGWEVSGIAGAIVATLAFLLPACALAFVMGHLWVRFRDRQWRKVVQAGLVPVTAGLMVAAAYLLVRDAAVDWRALVLSAGVAIGCLFTKRHPLWFLGLAALAGLIGFR